LIAIVVTPVIPFAALIIPFATPTIPFAALIIPFATPVIPFVTLVILFIALITPFAALIIPLVAPIIPLVALIATGVTIALALTPDKSPLTPAKSAPFDPNQSNSTQASADTVAVHPLEFQKTDS
jgi:hypothetical protein